MWVTNLSGLGVLGALLLGVAVTGLIAWLVPSAKKRAAQPEAFSGAQITRYDRFLPAYALFGVVALLVGAVHGLIKNLPGIFGWLLTADHGGEMARDLSNTHVFVVAVGTVLLGGLTWYVLPRVAGRPLYSDGLATASFWFTTVGVSGFYLTWVVLGIIEGNMVQHGLPYPEAKALLGKWHSVPFRATASLLGLGYWTYTLNVLMTVASAWRARRRRPQGHLLKFFALGTVALTVGTVQGVLQVLPDNEAWIQATDAAGHMIDPVSHAHVNLVLGAAVLTIASFCALASRLGAAPVGVRWANRTFWVLLSGGLAFYLSMLLLGLYEGRWMLASHLSYNEVVARLGWRHTAPILLGGLVMTAGLWMFLWTLLQSSRAAPRPVRLALRLSALSLLMGTFQGPLQAVERVRAWYDEAGALGQLLPGAHAQLNILGGLTPLAVLLGLALLPGAPREALARAVTWLGRGALVIYAGLAGAGVRAAMLTAAHDRMPANASGEMRTHFINLEVLRAVAPVTITLELLGFALYALGAGALLRLVWPLTADFRARMRAARLAYPLKVTGPLPPALRRIPPALLVTVEAGGALAGFPGLGWFLAGVPVVGWPLASIGPALAWALLPLILSPYDHALLSTYLVYFPATALVSAAALAWNLRLRRRASTPPGRRLPPRVLRARRAVLAGAGVLSAALLTTLVVPLLSVGQRASYTALRTLPDASRGMFLVTSGAYVRPYPWYDEPPGYPPDSLTLARTDRIVVQDKRTGGAGDYRLVNLASGLALPLRELKRARVGQLEQLTLATGAPLPSARYLLVADQASSMYGGSVQYYFGVDPAAAPLTFSPEVKRPAMAVSSVTPASSLVTALLGFVLSGLVWLDYRRKPAAHRLWWAAGLSCFALASGAEVAWALHGGWSSAAYRLWYLFGALLAATLLGHGTAALILPRRVTARLTWALVFVAGFVTSLALLSPLHLGELGAADQLSGRAFTAIASAGLATPRLYTPFLNVYGAGFLVLGGLYSAWRGRAVRRRRGVLLIAGGALVMSAAGVVNRLGFSGAQSVAEMLSLLLIFWGFWWSARLAPVAARSEDAPLTGATPRILGSSGD